MNTEKLSEKNKGNDANRVLANVVWNEYPKLLPTKDLQDECAGNNYLCKYRTSIGYEYEVCRWADKLQVFDSNSNAFQPYRRILVAWAVFNGC